MDNRAELDFSLMTLSLESRETEDLYAQFMTPEAILLSKRFLRQNLRILRKAEDRFHVEKELIVAILLVYSTASAYFPVVGRAERRKREYSLHPR